jgi:hypothetical protein
MPLDAPASFEYAKEAATQVLTLCTGVIALSATFAKELATGDRTTDRRLLWGSWILLLLSLLLGVGTLGAMAANLDDAKATHSIWTGSIVVYALGQFGLFILGIGVLIIQAARRVAA